MVLDPWARGLDQFAILHARRTGCQAGHTAQASVDVSSKRCIDADLALRGHLHQLDTATRRVHLLAPQQIGGAGRQAEAAMHTISDQFRIGWMVLIKTRKQLGVYRDSRRMLYRYAHRLLLLDAGSAIIAGRYFCG